MHPCGFDGTFVNVAAYLPLRATTIPHRIAVAFPQTRDASGRVAWTHLTFVQIEELSADYAAGLAASGISRGQRVLFMARPGLDFIALAFSLFRIGAVPVLIDPGMGIYKLLGCIRQVAPEALLAVSEVVAAMAVFRGTFASVRTVVTIGRNWWWKGPCTADFVRPGRGGFPGNSANEKSIFEGICRTAPDEPAAILFTTGSTGPAKGVVYLHRMFEAQVSQLRNYYGIREGEVEMPAFPLFALFSPALGITCVIPEMDPTRPATVDPVKIVEAINAFGVTNTFGSPSIWRRVTDHCVRNGIRLPSLRRVLMAGAPVPIDVLGKFTQILSPRGETHTPYGATETLPTTNATGTMILDPARVRRNREGSGTFVGEPLPGMTVRVIRIDDGPIPVWDDSLEVPPGQIGEIVASGPVTTLEYFGRERDTALAKIRDGSRVWHRMGDIGYFDEDGMLWFCGRKAHRVMTASGTMFTVCCEAIFNTHPRVLRSSLVGVPASGGGVGLFRQAFGHGSPKTPAVSEPVIVIEPVAGTFPETLEEVRVFIAELLEIGSGNPRTAVIKTVLFHRKFPTDIRHNAKIFREKLAVWAAGRLSAAGFLWRWADRIRDAIPGLAGR